MFIDGTRFFDQYEFTSQSLKQAAELYVKAEGSGKILLLFIKVQRLYN